MSTEQAEELPILSDEEYLQHVRSLGPYGALAADWIVDLESALRIAQDQAMENGHAANQYRLAAELNKETVEAQAAELARMHSIFESLRMEYT